ncbi:hypothetical protein RHSIM_Rhsim09G0079900 [Rhododendron simsii]|uniref:Reverse transcriptase domain-containing protein n=1 Tax=Rhododendron simsii TaxID=118357 RepID=A0A834GH69_RHOSS|nr:hypothetical protein RHSIM_Rhsim09G0079900 [Rhododendron simsii]
MIQSHINQNSCIHRFSHIVLLLLLSIQAGIFATAVYEFRRRWLLSLCYIVELHSATVSACTESIATLFVNSYVLTTGMAYQCCHWLLCAYHGYFDDACCYCYCCLGAVMAIKVYEAVFMLDVSRFSFMVSLHLKLLEPFGWLHHFGVSKHVETGHQQTLVEEAEESSLNPVEELSGSKDELVEVREDADLSLSCVPRATLTSVVNGEETSIGRAEWSAMAPDLQGCGDKEKAAMVLPGSIASNKSLSKSAKNKMRKLIREQKLNVLPVLIDPVQSGFVKGRRIADNIFLTQELMRGYHKSSTSPRCAMKVYIRKAYDNVRWDFLWDILSAMNFHPTMIKWLQACVTTANYTISLNGEATDDLMIFCKGDLTSISHIQEALSEFQMLSGLSPNPEKSSIYFSGVNTITRMAILDTGCDGQAVVFCYYVGFTAAMLFSAATAAAAAPLAAVVVVHPDLEVGPRSRDKPTIVRDIFLQMLLLVLILLRSRPSAYCRGECPWISVAWQWEYGRV